MKKSYLRDEVNIKRLGKKLKEIRLEKGFSQEQLANECDLPISQIGRIERGTLNTSVSHIFLIAGVLKVHPKELFDFKI